MFTMFKHLDPVTVNLRTPQLLREFARLYLSLYKIFHQAVALPETC